MYFILIAPRFTIVFDSSFSMVYGPGSGTGGVSDMSHAASGHVSVLWGGARMVSFVMFFFLELSLHSLFVSLAVDRLFDEVVSSFHAAILGSEVSLVLLFWLSFADAANGVSSKTGSAIATSTVAASVVIFVVISVSFDVFSAHCTVVAALSCDGINFDASCACCCRCCFGVFFTGGGVSRLFSKIR